VPAIDEALQFGIQRRACRYAGQKLLESQLALCLIHAQFHLATDSIHEFEMALLDFAETAKHAPVGVSLQALSDYIQRPLCHFVDSRWRLSANLVSQNRNLK
jgi:hypothetical protein